MKLSKYSTCFAFIFLSSLLSAQSEGNIFQILEPVPYNQCAAIFYNGKMLVDSYSPEGKCKLEEGMKGTLTLSAVKLDEEGGEAIKNLSFKVAIKNKRTNTIWMYSEQTVREIDIEAVIDKCQSGDKILILTTQQEYSLTHHEIDVMKGC